jgi:hypothetical protein
MKKQQTEEFRYTCDSTVVIREEDDPLERLDYLEGFAREMFESNLKIWLKAKKDKYTRHTCKGCGKRNPKLGWDRGPENGEPVSLCCNASITKGEA